MNHAFLKLPLFTHPLIDDHKAKLNDTWEVGGHIYVIVALSYVTAEVEFLINYMTNKTFSMDEALILLGQMKQEQLGP